MADLKDNLSTCEKPLPDVAAEQTLDPEIAEILLTLREALMGISLRQLREEAGRGELLKRRLREVSRG